MVAAQDRQASRAGGASSFVMLPVRRRKTRKRALLTEWRMGSHIDGHTHNEFAPEGETHMTFRRIALAVAIVAIAALAPAAMAQDGRRITPERQSFDPEPCGPINANQPCYAGGSNPTVVSCIAYSTRGQMCHACHPNPYGKIICTYSNYNSYCSCSNDQVPGAAPGITECHASGTCDYL